MKLHHIVPSNDIKDHILNECCHCKPDILILDTDTHYGKIVVHHAFDCRELFKINMELNN